MNDRYRGITGDVTSCSSTNATLQPRAEARRSRRYTVVADAGSKPGRRVMRNLTAVAYNIAQGSIAAYYPEECPGCA